MRPHGEIRQVLRQALSSGAGTTRDLASRTNVGLEAARLTLDNMVRAGEAVKLAQVKVPGAKRPVPVYAAQQQQHTAAQAAQALADAIGVWALDVAFAE